MTQQTDKYVIWTDGACSGNPGPGAWAFLIHRNDEFLTEECGSVQLTTNNQMELQAIAEALWEIPDGAKATIITDSKNVIGWLSQGWKRKVPAINALCAGIDATILSKELTIVFHWVKGHAGDPPNERVNMLAQGAIKR